MCSSEAWLILIAFHGPCPRSPSITTQLWVPFNKGSTKAEGELLVFASEIGSLIFPASRCFLVSLLDAHWYPDSSANSSFAFTARCQGCTSPLTKKWLAVAVQTLTFVVSHRHTNPMAHACQKMFSLFCCKFETSVLLGQECLLDFKS